MSAWSKTWKSSTSVCKQSLLSEYSILPMNVHWNDYDRKSDVTEYHTADMFRLSFPHSRLITGFVTNVKQQAPLVDLELPTLLKYPIHTQFLVRIHIFSSCSRWCPLLFSRKKRCSAGLYSHLFCMDGSFFSYAICIYLCILVSNTISISHDVRDV
jgi:hypothetical protein